MNTNRKQTKLISIDKNQINKSNSYGREKWRIKENSRCRMREGRGCFIKAWKQQRKKKDSTLPGSKDIKIV